MTRKTAGSAPRPVRLPVTHPRSVPIAALEAEGEPDQPFEEGTHDAVDPDLRHRMISEAAFYLYAQRGYADGYDLDDWLTAQAEIDHVLVNPETRGSSAGAY